MADAQVVVPPAEYAADYDMQVLWRKMGVLIEVAQERMAFDMVASVILSRVTREMRRVHGVETTRKALELLAASMDEVAKHDRT